jgi:hypothetical protein
MYRQKKNIHPMNKTMMTEITLKRTGTQPEGLNFHNRRSLTCGTEYTSTLCLKGRTKTQII